MAIKSSVVVMGRIFGVGRSGRRFAGRRFRRRVREGPIAIRLGRDLVDDGGGGAAAGGVHPHVQRAGLTIGKTADGIVDLRAGHAKVGEDRIDPFDAAGRQNGGQCGEVAVMSSKLPPIRRAFRGRSRCWRDRNQSRSTAGWTDPFEDRGRVAAQAEGAVDDDLARAGSRISSTVSSRTGMWRVSRFMRD